jgi:hypothetical protein
MAQGDFPFQAISQFRKQIILSGYLGFISTMTTPLAFFFKPASIYVQPGSGR